MQYIFFTGLLLLATGGAFVGTLRGWGLTSMLDEPVSIREASVQRGIGGGAAFLYFGGIRGHRGGGLRGGK